MSLLSSCKGSGHMEPATTHDARKQQNHTTSVLTVVATMRPLTESICYPLSYLTIQVQSGQQLLMTSPTWFFKGPLLSNCNKYKTTSWKSLWISTCTSSLRYAFWPKERTSIWSDIPFPVNLNRWTSILAWKSTSHASAEQSNNEWSSWFVWWYLSISYMMMSHPS